MNIESTELFTEKAKQYAAHRPHYSQFVLKTIREKNPPPAIVADVGAGTGIFSLQLLKEGYEVCAVEPNDAMRQEGIDYCRGFPTLKYLKGSGENTRLLPASVDLITIAQAFHWLDKPKAKIEFQRIAKTDCAIAVVWNTRKFESSEFMLAYKKILLEYSPKYSEMAMYWKTLEEDVKSFLSATEQNRYVFRNSQIINLDTLIGNLESTSYVPKIDNPGYARIMTEMRNIFDRFQQDGCVEFNIDTILYLNNVLH